MVELDHNVMISASVLPSKDLVDQIKNLKQNQSIYYKDELMFFLVCLMLIMLISKSCKII